MRVTSSCAGLGIRFLRGATVRALLNKPTPVSGVVDGIAPASASGAPTPAQPQHTNPPMGAPPARALAV